VLLSSGNAKFSVNCLWLFLLAKDTGRGFRFICNVFNDTLKKKLLFCYFFLLFASSFFFFCYYSMARNKVGVFYVWYFACGEGGKFIQKIYS
jgi:hypothetical protein